VSKGSFYWYYPSKQAVFVDIFDTWGRQVMDEVFGQFESALRGEGYVEAMTQALRREVHRGRAIVPLWLESSMHARHDEAIRSALARFYAQARAAIAQMLRARAASRLSEAEVQGLAAACVGAYIGLIVQELPDPAGANSKAAIDHLMSVIGRACGRLAAPAAKERPARKGTERSRTPAAGPRVPRVR
jgi:AcrR family transcriptional regulator